MFKLLHFMSKLHIACKNDVVKFEVFTAVDMKMPYSGMLRRVVLVRTDVSEELSATIIRVTKIDELGKTLAVTSNRRTVRRLLVRLTLFLVHQFLSP
jgi:hypothetical protein